MRRQSFTKAILIGLLAMASPGWAARVAILELPTKWRLEQYVNGSTVAWYTGSTAQGCLQGKIELTPAVSQEERSRFWSLVLTAKSQDKRVLVFFDTPSCSVVSFGMAEE